jgi:carbon storage regulator
MLVLSRKRGQSVVIGNDIRVIVQRVNGNRVTLGIEAPDHVHILRGELELCLDDALPGTGQDQQVVTVHA